MPKCKDDEVESYTGACYKKARVKTEPVFDNAYYKNVLTGYHTLIVDGEIGDNVLNLERWGRNYIDDPDKYEDDIAEMEDIAGEYDSAFTTLGEQIQRLEALKEKLKNKKIRYVNG